MTRQTASSYILCTTPRTGSTWLCSLLKATEVAGKPESFFRSQDVSSRAFEWGISQPDGTFSFRAFLDCVLERGRSDNGVFAARIMWGTLPELISNLRSIGMMGSDMEVLTQAFGPTKCVYLERRDALAQSVSRLRAEQSKVWHIKREGDREAARHSVSYDRNAIQQYIDESRDDALKWNSWFKENNIVPLRLSYEDMLLDQDAQLSRVLNFVGQKRRPSGISTANVRMADEISEEWAQRFRVETGLTS